MNSEHLNGWLKNIQNTREQEISCSECFDQVSHFVDAELAGEDAAAQMPLVKQHLEQCPACREEYETLRDLERLENEGGMPSTEDLEDLIH